MLSVTPTD